MHRSKLVKPPGIAPFRRPQDLLGMVERTLALALPYLCACTPVVALQKRALAIAVGVAVLLFMPDSPTNARFLSKEERIAAIERIRDQQGGTENKRLKKEQVVEALLDIRTWLIVLATLLSTFTRFLTRQVSCLTYLQPIFPMAD